MPIESVNTTEEKQVPEMISTRLGDLAPLAKKWAADNPDVPWAVLGRKGLKLALKQYATKREAHLVN